MVLTLASMAAGGALTMVTGFLLWTFLPPIAVRYSGIAILIVSLAFTIGADRRARRRETSERWSMVGVGAIIGILPWIA
jgi:hypothetical protein